MESKDDHGDHAPHGNEWEVISLSASAYTAAPGPINLELKDARKYDAYYEAETSDTLFVSDHFVFPPSEHENLPIETFFAETNNNKVSKDVGFLFERDQEKNTDEEDETDLTMKGADLPCDFPMKGADLSPEGGVDLHSDSSNPLRPAKDAKDAAYNLPCEAWWRKRAVSVYAQAKEANTFWSLFIAATVTGLVIFSQRLQQERWQVLHLKWQSSISSEKMSRILGPLTRFKDAIIGGNRQASFIRSGSLGV
ncbi:PREDICTED: ATG8-interacting protein 1-like [Tarenaya hassleriana]|uniref:ATG8-interacting protein 1-like n=1 Tax=Tarenaya hassleriana TaxID=28532 RepID=UPI00053C6B3E|nr:PREDICTED: ATG8-interacting protein 1-like [Tarenaya hassleriana]